MALDTPHQEQRPRYYAFQRCDMHYYGRLICLPKVRTLQPKQLLPISYWYMYANFASEVGGAICIIMTGLFVCQKVRWVEVVCILFFECPKAEILPDHFLRQSLL